MVSLVWLRTIWGDERCLRGWTFLLGPIAFGMHAWFAGSIHSKDSNTLGYRDSQRDNLGSPRESWSPEWPEIPVHYTPLATWKGRGNPRGIPLAATLSARSLPRNLLLQLVSGVSLLER